MLEAAAVLFTIQIPTTAEEQRLKLKKRQQREREATTKTKQAEPCTLRISPANESTVVKCPATQLADVVEHVELNGTPLDTAMEEVLRQILHKFNINNAMWLRNLEGNAYQITFSLEFDELYENLSEALQQFGIGDREGSTVSVTNCIASTSFATNSKEAGKKPIDKCSGAINNNAHKHSGWNRFMNSVRSRLNVTQIVRDVRQDAAITFDFCILLVSAAILASFGLVENSTIFLASSMLISPLMGPNIAAIFGTVIQERSLRRLGMRNELIGILMATLVGFLFGLVVCTTDKKYGIGEGLTEEMLSRCDVHSLVVGLFTAIPSGAAAAIGILGGNIGSLVGVAISASLLPPAVNSGLLWALACIYKLFEHDDSLYVDVVKSRKYSDNQATELAVLGGISMCLTLSNVLFIYMMGILVLKVKQIAPVIGRSNRQFWKHDIKLSRGDAAIIDQLLANLAKEQPQDMHDDFLRQLDEHAYQHTWSPRSIRHSFSTQQPYCNVSTIHRLEQLYKNAASERLNPEEPTARPRLNSMPSHPNLMKLPLPTTFINMPVPRFTVTPAAEDVLHK